VVPRPVAGHGLVFVSTSLRRRVAAGDPHRRPGRRDRHDIAWTLKQGAPHNPSPAVGRFTNCTLCPIAAIATCLDAKTETSNGRSGFRAISPRRRCSRAGTCISWTNAGQRRSWKAGKPFQLVSKNGLGGVTLAVARRADGAIYFRNDTHLYKIEARK